VKVRSSAGFRLVRGNTLKLNSFSVDVLSRYIILV
jgi:hypothetical protein